MQIKIYLNILFLLLIFGSNSNAQSFFGPDSYTQFYDTTCKRVIIKQKNIVFNTTLCKIDLLPNGFPARTRYYVKGRLSSTTTNISDTFYTEGENYTYTMKTRIVTQNCQLPEANYVSTLSTNKMKGLLFYKMFDKRGDTMQCEIWRYNQNNEMVSYKPTCSKDFGGFEIRYRYDDNRFLKSKEIVHTGLGQDHQPLFCYYFYSSNLRTVELIYAASPKTDWYREIPKTRRKKIKQASVIINSLKPHFYDLKVLQVTVFRYDHKNRLISSKNFYRDRNGSKSIYKY